MSQSVFGKGTRQDLQGCFMGPIGGPGVTRADSGVGTRAAAAAMLRRFNLGQRTVKRTWHHPGAGQRGDGYGGVFVSDVRAGVENQYD